MGFHVSSQHEQRELTEASFPTSSGNSAIENPIPLTLATSSVQLFNPST